MTTSPFSNNVSSSSSSTTTFPSFNQQLQYAGCCVYPPHLYRYAYTSGALLSGLHAKAQQEAVARATAEAANMTAEELAAPRYPRAVKRYPYQDDAFHTIMQWLFSRIPDTR
jgi:hypothetical protein